ncbi:hypothetical protein FACS189459_5670 [Bacilli bacterium]|nr:hypothetical protein FACS189459_5670 [Bacilli bacterium]
MVYSACLRLLFLLLSNILIIGIPLKAKMIIQNNIEEIEFFNGVVLAINNPHPIVPLG